MRIPQQVAVLGQKVTPTFMLNKPATRLMGTARLSDGTKERQCEE